MTMKMNSDNFRQSAIRVIIQRLREKSISIIIYEPTLEQDEFDGIPIEHNLDDFKEETTVIVANRMSDELQDVSEKVYTRDLYNVD